MESLQESEENRIKKYTLTQPVDFNLGTLDPRQTVTVFEVWSVESEPGQIKYALKGTGWGGDRQPSVWSVEADLAKQLIEKDQEARQKN